MTDLDRAICYAWLAGESMFDLSLRCSLPMTAIEQSIRSGVRIRSARPSLSRRAGVKQKRLPPDRRAVRSSPPVATWAGGAQLQERDLYRTPASPAATTLARRGK